MPGDSRQSGPTGADGSGGKGAAPGFSEAAVEQFVRDSLSSAIAQYASKGGQPCLGWLEIDCDHM
jgi:hypothetical protein